MMVFVASKPAARRCSPAHSSHSWNIKPLYYASCVSASSCRARRANSALKAVDGAASTAAALPAAAAHTADSGVHNQQQRQEQRRQEGHGLKVVLVNPQIPQNAGNAARSCAAAGAALHLVGPLGFEITDKQLKRAGLDYWQFVCVDVHASWAAFLEAFAAAPAPKRLVAFTVYGSRYYAAPEFSYRPGDWLVFGSETAGLPPAAHGDIGALSGELVKVPISTAHVRSLNLATTVGIGLFEALRQVGPHEVAPRDDSGLQPTAMAAWLAAQQQQQQQEQQQQQQETQQQPLPALAKE